MFEIVRFIVLTSVRDVDERIVDGAAAAQIAGAAGGHDGTVRIADAQGVRRDHERGRAHRIAGVGLGVAGLALSGAGAYFAVRAAERSDINAGCTNQTPCPGELIETRKHEWRNATIASSEVSASASTCR